MQRFNPSIYLLLTETASRFSPPPPARLSGDAAAYANMAELFENSERECMALGFRASTRTLSRLRGALRSDAAPPVHDVASLFRELISRLMDEMLHTCFLALNPEETNEYDVWRDGWEVILQRFPDVTRDVEESRKCKALQRYAAAVFHSTQVIEIGLLALGKFIGVSDPHSGWTAVTNELTRIVVKTGHEKRTPFQNAHFPFLEQMHGTVEALKNAWRNKISHAQQRLVLLTSDFTPEVTEEILLATRAFMRRLATDLPEAAPVLAP